MPTKHPKPEFYVTQGIIQVELKTDAVVISINPIQGFSVKHGKEDYIVFLPETVSPTRAFDEALIFKRTQHFKVGKRFETILAGAAVQGTKIEIKMKTPPSSPPHDPLEIEIESITIPSAPLIG